MKTNVVAFIGRKLLTTFIMAVAVTVLFTVLLSSGGLEGLELENVNDGYFLLSFFTGIVAAGLLFYGMIFSIIIELISQRWFKERWMYVLLHVMFALIFVFLSAGFKLIPLITAFIVALLYVGVDRAIFNWANKTSRWLLLTAIPFVLYILGYGFFRLIMI